MSTTPGRASAAASNAPTGRATRRRERVDPDAERAIARDGDTAESPPWRRPDDARSTDITGHDFAARANSEISASPPGGLNTNARVHPKRPAILTARLNEITRSAHAGKGFLGSAVRGPSSWYCRCSGQAAELLTSSGADTRRCRHESLGGRVSTPHPAVPSELTVSVVVRSKNKQDTIERTLRSLRAQTVPAQVIVVDSGSTDGTLDIARAYDAEIIETPPAEIQLRPRSQYRCGPRHWRHRVRVVGTPRHKATTGSRGVLRPIKRPRLPAPSAIRRVRIARLSPGQGLFPPPISILNTTSPGACRTTRRRGGAVSGRTSGSTSR